MGVMDVMGRVIAKDGDRLTVHYPLIINIMPNGVPMFVPFANGCDLRGYEFDTKQFIGKGYASEIATRVYDQKVKQLEMERVASEFMHLKQHYTTVGMTSRMVH